MQVSPEKVQSFFEKTKKEIKADLAINTVPSSHDSAYNLEEFAVEEPEEELIDDLHLKTTGSQFEINKSDLKPTISIRLKNMRVFSCGKRVTENLVSPRAESEPDALD